LGLLAVALSAFLIAGSYHIQNNLEEAEVAFAPMEKTYTITDAQWQDTEWQKLPDHRIDLVGKPEELFSFQWAGSLDVLQSVLEARKWVFSKKWTWHNIFAYLDPNAPLASVAPAPALHEGLKAKLTMLLPIPGDVNRRLVFRAFKTGAILKTESAEKPVFLISLTQESLRKTLHTYAVPVLSPASDDDVKQLETDITSGPGTTSVIERRKVDARELLLMTGP
jgi:hypothetical protein